MLANVIPVCARQKSWERLNADLHHSANCGRVLSDIQTTWLGCPSPAGSSALRPIIGRNTCGCPIKPTNPRWRIDTATFTSKCLSPHLSTASAWQKYLSPCWPSLVLVRQKSPLCPARPLDLFDDSSAHCLVDVVGREDAAHDHVEQPQRMGLSTWCWTWSRRATSQCQLQIQFWILATSRPPPSHGASTACMMRWLKRPFLIAWKWICKTRNRKIKLFRYLDILKPYELVFNAEDVKLVPVLIQVKPKLSRNLKGTHSFIYRKVKFYPWLLDCVFIPRLYHDPSILEEMPLLPSFKIM